MSVPDIYLSGERVRNMKLKKSRGKDGKLKIYKLSEFEPHKVISVLKSLTSALLNKYETKSIILDTG